MVNIVKRSNLALSVLFLLLILFPMISAYDLPKIFRTNEVMGNSLILENVGENSFSTNSQEIVYFEYGTIRPKKLSDSEWVRYFNSLDLEDSSTYVLLRFKGVLDKIKLSEIESDGAKILGKYGSENYVCKFPKEVLETKKYEFIDWIEIPKKDVKMDPKLVNSLQLDKSLIVKIQFYEEYTDEELGKLNRYGKFINKDNWDLDEGSIYALLSPRSDENSIHPAEEIASLNFVKSVKLISIEDVEMLNLFVDQSEFYSDKSLAVQSHSICPWTRSQGQGSEVANPVLISQNEKSGKLNSLNLVGSQSQELYEYLNSENYKFSDNFVEMFFDNHKSVILTQIYKESDLDHTTFFVHIQDGLLGTGRSYVLDLYSVGAESFFEISDRQSGATYNLQDYSLVSEWGSQHHSCTGNQCIGYGVEYALGTGFFQPCSIICSQTCTQYPSLVSCGPCLTCLLGFEMAIWETCISDSCYFYPCQQDCSDNDGWGSWQYYCNGGDVWRLKYYTDYECFTSEPREGTCEVNDSGSGWGQEELYESCTYGCTAGICDPEIECSSDSDCPSDQWVGSRYCNGGDVWQTYREYYCTSPGTPSSDCEYDDDEVEVRDCSDGCDDGECTGGAGNCDWDEYEEDCTNGEDERAQLQRLDGTGDAFDISSSSTSYICGWDDCGPNDLAYALKFDIDDCDGYLDEDMLDKVLRVRLRWWNDAGEDDCSDTDLYYYTEDEDDLNNPSSHAEELTDDSNWDLVDETCGGCDDGVNLLDLTSEYIDDLRRDDDDEIAYAWWPEDDQDEWRMNDAGDPELDIEYCKPCPDEDDDGYNRENRDCGTDDDCNDYNPYINPGSNIYCDCNVATGGGSREGTEEICDNIDNDCDGSVDEYVLQGCGVGVCSGGYQYCSAGSWGSCSTNYLSTSESCNGLDDDCDGSVDESLSQECGTDIGACVSGTQYCSAGSWGSCGGDYVGPVEETCNSIDDNCNGVIDENNVCGDYPNATLIWPEEDYVSQTGNVTLNCSVSDDLGLANVSLYHNIQGNMTLNDTLIVSGLTNETFWTFTNLENMTNFTWNCLVFDIDSHWSWSQNGPRTVFVNINSTNNPPTQPNSILCDGSNCTLPENFFDSIHLNCSGSTDPESDSITYFVEAYYNNSGDYSWMEIGNHTESDVFNWNISSLDSQVGVNLRCRAKDVEGSGIFSSYFDPELSLILNPSTLPIVGIDMVFPREDENLTWGEFFNVTLNVSCSNTDCGLIDVSLDPEQETYTPYSSLVCEEGTCTKTIYSSVRFVYEDNVWKPIEEANSLKGIWKAKIDLDPNFPLEVLDFNFNSITLDLSVAKSDVGRNIPLQIYDLPIQEDSFGEVENEKEYFQENQITINRVGNKVIKKIELNDLDECILGKEIKWGDHSTRIQIVEPDSENLEDTYVLEGNSSNFGSESRMKAGKRWEGLIETYVLFNLTGIPQDAEIELANLYLFASQKGYTRGSWMYIKSFESNSTDWDETVVDWFSRPDYNSSSNSSNYHFFNESSSIGSWYDWDISSIIGKKILEGSGAVSLTLAPIYSEGSVIYMGFSTKERPYSYQWPYLNITYTVGNTKGLVSEVHGATPFYTNSSNPLTVELDVNESTTVTFWVNSTGEVDSVWTFFAFANLSSSPAISSVTDKVDLTISAPEDITSPSFTNIPSNSSITYGDLWGVGFEASDDVSVDSFFINWTDSFTINETGWLTNSTQLDSGDYVLNVSVNDTSGNIASVMYSLVVNPLNSTVYTYVNHTRSNLTLFDPETLMINGSFVGGNGVVHLFLNEELVGMSESEVSEEVEFSNGQYNVTTIYFGDENHNPASETWWVTVNITLPDDSFKFFIRSGSGLPVAWFGSEGNLALKGSCFNQTVCTAPGDSFKLGNSTDETTSYIDSNGNLCLEGGDCSDQLSLCNPEIGAFIIRNATSTNVSYIDYSGRLCVTGRIYERSNL